MIRLTLRSNERTALDGGITALSSIGRARSATSECERSHLTIMKINHIVLFVLCCTLSGCDRRVEATNPTTTTTPSLTQGSDEQIKRQQAQLDAYDRQSKHAEEQLHAQADMQKRADDILRAQEDMHKRSVAVLAAQEQLLKRQQDDFTRWEKILGTWEGQQKQYQKYLDSLSK
jgi:hypothetical protein